MDKQTNTSQSRKSTHRNAVSIDNYQANPQQRLTVTSPRSLKAMRQLGYTQEDFHYLSFREYVNTHHDIRSLSPPLQRNRYETQDHLRLEKIKEVIKLRETIEAHSIEKSEEQQKKADSNDELICQDDVKSTAINEELKAFERIKRKNEADLINMVEYELKKQIMLKEAEQRMRKQQFKVTQFQRETELSRQQEAIMQKNREEQKLLKQQEDEERQRQLNAQRYIEEQKKLQKKMEEEENRQKLNRLHHEEDERKRFAFQQKVDLMLEEKMQRANERRDQMDQRDEERRIALEKRRQQTFDEANEKTRLKQEQITRNMTNLNEHLESVRQKYLMKQRENDLKKERLDIERDNQMKQRQEDSRLRAEKTKNVLDKDREIQQKKLNDYNAKQQLISMEKQIIEKDKKKQQEEHRHYIEEREQHRLSTIARNEELLSQRKMNIIAKMSLKEEMTRKCHQKREEEQMEKAELDYQRKLLSESNIRRVEIMKQNKREDTLNWIVNKSNKIQLYKEQKEMISEKKRQLKDSISRKKEEYEIKFQQMFHKKDPNKTMETIQKMFPENEKINVLLERLSEIDKENETQLRVEREYEESMQNTLSEFKKSINTNNSNTQALKQSQTDKNKKSNTSLSKTNPDFKKLDNNHINTSEPIKNKVNVVEAKPDQINPKPQTLRSKSKGKEAIKTKATRASNTQTNRTITSASTKTSKGQMYQSQNSPEFTFKQCDNSKREFTTSNTIANDRYNQSGNTMQSSSHLKSSANEEKEIEKKMNKYKLNLSNELLALITKEKKMEQKRVDLYVQAQGAQKDEIGKRIGEERVLSSLRIIEKNDEIEAKLKAFEENLRKNVMRSGYKLNSKSHS